MAETEQGKINWKGVEASAGAAASVALGLSTQLLSFLIRHGRLTKAEAAEIVGAARAAYKMSSQPSQPGSDDWQAQADALLRTIQNDVIR
jgi:hypothetical protein